MNDYVVFSLCAPMGSFGGFAGHERRNTEALPLRSAILGLLGAALGVRRTDSAGQKSLRKYRVATRLLSKGVTFRDFHTVQTIPSTVRQPDSRRHAIQLIGRKIKTTITVRDYLCDLAIGVVVWGGDDKLSLVDLPNALTNPKFALYVGRKSCPLTAPMAPRLVSANSPVEAVREAKRTDGGDEVLLGPVVSDPFPGGRPHRVESHPAEPLDRVRWHFEQINQWYFD